MGLVLRMNIQCNFLGVWIDENLTGKDHTHTLENKIAKNIGPLYRGKRYLDDICLKKTTLVTFMLI